MSEFEKMTVLELRKVAKEMNVKLGAGISKQGIVEKLNAVAASQQEQEAAAELEELLDMVVTPNAKVVKIALDEDLALSVNDMELLEPFVKFTDTEETS